LWGGAGRDARPGAAAAKTLVNMASVEAAAAVAETV
jgi:hypothetical protein